MSLLLAPAKGFDRAYYAVLPILGNFWCSVVTLVTFNSNLIYFKNNQENPFFYPKKMETSKNRKKSF